MKLDLLQKLNQNCASGATRVAYTDFLFSLVDFSHCKGGTKSNSS